MENLLTFDSGGISHRAVARLYGSIRQSPSYVPLQLRPPHTQSSGSSALCSYTTSTKDSCLRKRIVGAQVEICRDLFIPPPSLLFSLRACLSWSEVTRLPCVED